MKLKHISIAITSILSIALITYFLINLRIEKSIISSNSDSEITYINRIENKPTLYVRYYKDIQKGTKKGIIYFNEIFEFKWDKMYIFKPKTERKLIEETLGSNSFNDLGITEKSDVCLLVIQINQSDFFSMEIPTKICDFTKIDGLNGIAKDKAIFTITSIGESKIAYLQQTRH